MECILPIWNRPPPHADVVVIGGGLTGYGLGMCWAVGLAVAQVLNDEQTFFSDLIATFSPNRFY